MISPKPNDAAEIKNGGFQESAGPPADVSPAPDPLSLVENELRNNLLHAVRVALLGVAGSLSAKNAARGLKFVEQVCEHERNMLAFLSGHVEVRKKRGVPLLGDSSYTFNESDTDSSSSSPLSAVASLFNASEADGETFGAQAIKSIIDMVTSLVAKPKANANSADGARDALKKAEIEVAEAGLRAARSLGDEALIASRSAVLRELLKNENFVDGAGAFEPPVKKGKSPDDKPPETLPASVLTGRIPPGTRVRVLAVRGAPNYPDRWWRTHDAVVGPSWLTPIPNDVGWHTGVLHSANLPGLRPAETGHFRFSAESGTAVRVELSETGTAQGRGADRIEERRAARAAQERELRRRRWRVRAEGEKS